VRQVSRSVFGEFVRAGTCPTCSGSGKLIEHPCDNCNGSGRMIEERTLEVEIPAGIHDGQRIRLSGEGHAGLLGGRAGDVYVEVHVRPDERFVREGNDIYTTVDLTITQAALGATLNVPTLDGVAELTFEPGTQPGEIRVLRGRGLPVLQGFGRGSQRVLVNVTVPRRLTEEQRQLLEEFERLASAETYEPSEGFFDKLKSAFR
jgi:molecular chaperone DnaJ